MAILKTENLEKYTDEELINFEPIKYPMAREELCKRYLSPARKSYCMKVANVCLPSALDEWSSFDAYISALVISLARYTVSMNCLFRTFFISVLKNELLKELKEAADRLKTLSLDEIYSDFEGGECCLSDSVAVDESIYTTPTMYVDNMDLDAVIDMLPRHHKRIATRLVAYIQGGYSLVEACSMIPISYARGRYIITKLIELIKDEIPLTVNKGKIFR